MNTDAQTKQKPRGDPPLFLQLFISGDFKSNDFGTAHSKGLADAFFVTAYSKGVARAELRQSVGGGRQSTMQESVASAKLLAGFALHVASLVIIRQREIELRQKKT